jgi:VWFA-related protein
VSYSPRLSAWRTHSCDRLGGSAWAPKLSSHECERGTHECVRHCALYIAIAFALATSLEAQAPSFRVPARLVIAPTSVTDHRGQFINGLTVSDFTLFDNETPQKIYEDSDFLPISLAVAIQTNDTVAAMQPRIQELGPLLGTLVVGEGSEAAILTFDQRVHIVQDFSSDLGRLTHTLRHIEFSYTNSHLIDAVLEGIHMLKQRPEGRRRILLLISETRDQGSESKLRDAVAEAELNNILIYSLNISRAHAVREIFLKAYDGPAHTAISIDLLAAIKEIYSGAKGLVIENPLSVLTRYSGGEEFSFLKQHALEEAVGKIGKEIHGQYLLSYTPAHAGDSSYHAIRVTLNRPGLEVRSRPGYWASAQEFAAEPSTH